MSISNLSTSASSKNVLEIEPLIFDIVHFVNLFFFAEMISLVGIVANLVNVHVFRRQGYQDGVNVTLTALAVSDIGSLVNLVMYIVVINPGLPQRSMSLSKTLTGYIFFFLHEYFIKVSSVVTALASLERCLCVALPLKVTRMITPKVALAVNASIFIVIVAYLCCQYAIISAEWEFSPELNISIATLHFTYQRNILLPTAYYVFDIVLPYCTFALLITCSAIIFLKLKSQSKWRSAISTTGDKLSILTYKERKTAKLFMLVSIICVLLLLPYYILFAATAFNRELSIDGPLGGIFFMVSTFTLLFESINCSITIVIYYNMSSRYRTEFYKIYAKCNGRKLKKN